MTRKSVPELLIRFVSNNEDKISPPLTPSIFKSYLNHTSSLTKDTFVFIVSP